MTDWSLVNETLVARNSVIYWCREIVSLAVTSSGIYWSREIESPVDVNFVTCGCRVTVNLVVFCCGVVRSHVELGNQVVVAVVVVHSAWWKNCWWAC